MKKYATTEDSPKHMLQTLKEIAKGKQPNKKQKQQKRAMTAWLEQTYSSQKIPLRDRISI